MKIGSLIYHLAVLVGEGYDPDQQGSARLLDALAAPSRNVGLSGYSSVGGAFPSRKMGWSVPFESRSGELSLAIHLEFNPDVIAYLDQPPKVDVLRTNAAGETYPPRSSFFSLTEFTAVA